jgi:hypothetical protein
VKYSVRNELLPPKRCQGKFLQCVQPGCDRVLGSWGGSNWVIEFQRRLTGIRVHFGAPNAFYVVLQNPACDLSCSL